MTQGTEVHELALDKLIPSGTNPRKTFAEVELAELAKSIKHQGVLQPLTVRALSHGQGYEIVAGERRWKASKAAGLKTIPCIIRELSDTEVATSQVVENVQRDSLTPMEEALAYQHLLTDLGYSFDKLASEVGKSKAYLNGRFRLLTLIPAAQEALLASKLSLGVALELTRVADPERQAELLERCVDNGNGFVSLQTPEDVRDVVEQEYLLDLSAAPFDTKDAQLCRPDGIACTNCPTRTGAQEDLFGEASKRDTCLNATCWKQKVDATRERAVAKAQAKGVEVLQGAKAAKLLSKLGSYNSTHVAGDAKVEEIKGNVAKAAKAAGVEAVHVFDPSKNEVVALYDKKALIVNAKPENLSDYGKQVKKRDTQEQAEDSPEAKAKAERERKLANLTERAYHLGILKGLEDSVLGAQGLKLLAVLALEDVNYGYELAADALGLPGASASDAINDVIEKKNASAQEIYRTLLVTLSAQALENGYAAAKDAVEAGAKSLGVDLGKLKAAAKAEAVKALKAEEDAKLAEGADEVPTDGEAKKKRKK